MLFPTLNFGLFFLVVFAVAWGVRRFHGMHKGFLVAASYVFYAHWDWRFTGLLFASSILNHGAGLLIAGTDRGTVAGQRRRRVLVVGAVVINLAILGFFKYYDFFVASLGQLLFRLGIERDLPFLEIVLPVGISFFTFHGISYVVDVYRGKVEACRSLIDILLYISFFPQLVAGPIVRAHFFLPQLRVAPDPDRVLAGSGLLLILIGLFKKVVVANYLATDLVDPVFLDPLSAGTVDLLLAMYGYAIQIYCDFSAYSDIATGVAAMLGYRFPPNFNQPYRSASLREFWRRWHISLSSWLREYLYIPLGGSRGGAMATYRNLLLTMVLGGVWHGANWTFIVWGSLHGAALAVERAVAAVLFKGRAGPPSRFGQVLGAVLVFHFVCLTWIFFRSPDLDAALAYLGAFANTGEPTRLLTPFVLGLLAIGFAAQLLPPDLFTRIEAGFARLPAVAQGAMVAVGIFLVNALGPEGIAPFIYFQF